MFFIVAQVQPPPQPTWDLATQVHWFSERHLGIPVGFGVIFAISGMIAINNALIAYSMRRMSVSRAFGVFVSDHLLAQCDSRHAAAHASR